MSKYIIEIDFGNNPHLKKCLTCPLRDNDDSCKLQIGKNQKSWGEQLETCPLIICK